MANIVVAYICWFFGGTFGVHHFYLGRDKQAFVWWMTFGGLGLGWIRDLWRLPEYVYETNRDVRYLNEFQARRRSWSHPRFNAARFAGELLVGTILAYLFRLAIPETFIKEAGSFGNVIRIVLPVIGATVGVQLVANIGTEKVAWKPILIASCLAIPWLTPVEQSIITCPLFATIAATYYRQWDPDKVPPRGKCKCVTRASSLAVCGCVYLLLWGSAIYFNMSITASDGTSVPVHEAMDHFFKSPFWKEMKETIWHLYDYCQNNGWGHCYDQLLQKLDPTGEGHSLKVLEFEAHERPTPEEISSRCRQMSRKWHPDKFKKDSEKAEAQEKFIEIQKACEIINSIRRKRMNKNKQSDFSSRNSDSKRSDHTEF